MAEPLVVYTLEECAELLKCSRRTVSRLVARHELRAFKVGDTPRVSQAALDEFLSLTPQPDYPEPEPEPALKKKRKRRASGSGALFEQGGYWWAIISLTNRKPVRRRRRTRLEAELALAQLRLEYQDQLTDHAYPRKPSERVRSPRDGMSTRLRFTILQRDGFRCRYCGATAAEERLAVDHIISIIDGGTNDPDNLAAACQPCNAGKARRSVTVEQMPR